jgi:hypothetical protein
LFLALLALPAFADTTAGGVVLTTANLGGVGVVDVGVLPCLGGTGMVLTETERTGGLGQYCADDDATLVFGGPRIGRTQDVAFAYAGWDLGFGGGYASSTDDEGRLRAAFAFARPEVLIGAPLSFGSAELGLYAMIPVPFVQSMRGDARPRVAFPYAGVELTLLIGNFVDRKDRAPE